MYNLEGKMALVTGAGGEHGMGRAIATRLVFDNPEWSTLIIGNGPPLSAGGQSRQMLNLRVWW